MTDRAKQLIRGIAKATGMSTSDVLHAFADLEMFNSNNPHDKALLAAIQVEEPPNYIPGFEIGKGT